MAALSRLTQPAFIMGTTTCQHRSKGIIGLNSPVQRLDLMTRVDYLAPRAEYTRARQVYLERSPG